MDDYVDRQAHQVDRARTFAEIRRIEERAAQMARVVPIGFASTIPHRLQNVAEEPLEYIWINTPKSF